MKVLEDYPNCGKLGKAEKSIIDYPHDNLHSQCLRTCEWKENVMYKRYFKIPLWRNRKMESGNCWYLNDVDVSVDERRIERVKIYLTAPTIPRNLDCLTNCLVKPEKENTQNVHKKRKSELAICDGQLKLKIDDQAYVATDPKYRELGDNVEKIRKKYCSIHNIH